MDETLLPLGGAKQRAVLALLLLHANEVVSADRLIDELWGGSPPESASNMLQGYVSHLRKTLEPGRGRGEHELLVSQAPGYVLKVRSDQIDAERFGRLAGEGRRLLADGDAEAAAERLRAALALWRGLALADLDYEPSREPTSTGSKSCGCRRLRIALTRTWRSVATVLSSESYASSSAAIRSANGCARS